MNSYTAANISIDAYGHVLQASNSIGIISSVSTNSTLTGAGTVLSPLELPVIGPTGSYTGADFILDNYGRITSVVTGVSTNVCEFYTGSSLSINGSGTMVTITGYTGGNGNPSFNETAGIFTAPVGRNGFYFFAVQHNALFSALPSNGFMTISVYLNSSPTPYYSGNTNSMHGSTGLTLSLMTPISLTGGTTCSMGVVNTTGVTATLSSGTLTIIEMT